MISLETPLASRAIDIFNDKDKVQIFTLSSTFGGMGSLLGNLITFAYGKIAIVIFTAVFPILTVVNFLSIPEKNPKELDDDMSKISLKKTVKNYLMPPPKIAKTVGIPTIFWVICPGYWFYGTSAYAQIMMTKLNVTIEDHPEIYVENVNYAAMIMCLLPLSAMISGIVFNFLRIFERLERRTILIGIYALVGGASGVFFFFRNTFMFGLICVLMGMVVFFIYTVAFMMVDDFRNEPNYPADRGLAQDICMITIGSATGQLSTSFMFVGLLKYFAIPDVIPVFSAFWSIIGILWVALVVDFPNPKSTGTEIDEKMMTSRDDSSVIPA